jgi:hypothetical protein
MASFIIFKCPFCNRGLKNCGIGNKLSWYSCPDHGERDIKETDILVVREENLPLLNIRGFAYPLHAEPMKLPEPVPLLS